MTGQKSVGIVGAGFAGLRCADVLLAHGYKVTIFEARNRVGGRVGQSDHLGHLVDLGPNWIHGSTGNPIQRIAEQTGTQLHAWDETQAVINTDGKSLSPEEAGEYAQILWDDGMISAAFRYSEEQGSSIPSSRSLLDFFREKAEAYFTDLPADEAKRKRETLLNVASMWGAYVGSPIERQSLKFFWLEETIEGENPFVAETYHKILDHVAKPALEKARIEYECKVTGIRYGEKAASGKPTIETADGRSEQFDDVVVTTPLGWLKRNKAAFQPELPPRLSKAIDSIGYGCLDKVYITFPTAFWNTAPPTPATGPRTQQTHLDASHTTPNVPTKSHPLHQPPTSAAPPPYPGFTHWLSPTYASTNPSHWDQQGLNLAALPGPTAHPTILFYIYGPCSQHIASLVATTPPAELDSALIAFFRPYFSLLPHYASTPSHDREPTAVLATAWANDEFAGYGSYSNFQVGLEDGGRDIEVMREGLPEEGVWMAGEHTSPFVALGTTTGAWWSGEGVGGRIVERDGGVRGGGG